MMFRLLVSPAVKQEIAEAFHWYSERNVKAAKAFRDEVRSAFDLILKDPERWAVWDESIRRFILKHYPYTVYFSIVDDQVRILAVGHHRRPAGYWTSRQH